MRISSTLSPPPTRRRHLLTAPGLEIPINTYRRPHHLSLRKQIILVTLGGEGSLRGCNHIVLVYYVLVAGSE